MRSVPSALRHGLLTLWICTCIAVPITHAGNGAIGIFTDTNASACDLRVSPGGTATFYVVLAPDGTTRGGITGVQFQIDASKASGYQVFGELAMSDVTIQQGSAFSGGINLVWAECISQLTLPVLKFQILNTGGGIADAPLLVGAHSDAVEWNPLFDCPLVTLCDFPAFTSVCITGGAGIVNSSFDVTCGSGAQRQQWSRVKALFR